MVDRNTKVRGNQIKDSTVTKVDMDATGETVGTSLTVQSGGSLDFEFPAILADSDGDTKIQVEESADEDIIRFDTLGVQRAILDVNGLQLASGADVNEFSTDGTLAGNSDDACPTEKAVKTYVDANAGGGASTFLGTFTRNLSDANASVGYTGVGFQPTAIYFIMTAGGDPGVVSWGFSTGSGTANNKVHYGDGDSGNDFYFITNRCIHGQTQASQTQKGVVTSLDSDGFTISWTKENNPSGTMDITYLAIG